MTMHEPSRKSFRKQFAAALAAAGTATAALFVWGCLESATPNSSEGGAQGNTLATAGSVSSPFAEKTIATGIAAPTAMEIAPDGRIFVCEQAGKVRVIKNGALLPTPFLSLSVNHDGERGILGIAFDPNFATASTKYVYVYYTNTSGPHNRVSRFTANGDVAVAGSEKALINLPNLGAIYHNGGAIHFGKDGKLYIAVGDNKTGKPGSTDGAMPPQTTTSLLGKILRINSDGTIPGDNPFLGESGLNRAIWALGLRNPFTFAFQPGTGRMFINDVGEATAEEINDGVKGGNYGWPASEGTNNTGGFKGPLYTYPSTSDKTECAIIGGAFYNPTNARFPSGYVGNYFYCDYCAGWMRIAGKSGNFATGIDSPVDIKVSNDGYLYYLTHPGKVVRVDYTGTSAPSIAQNPSNVTVSIGGSATFTVSANGTSLAYQWQRNQADISGATSASYTRANVQTGDNGSKYRCVVKNSSGTATSSEATLTVTSNTAPVATITAPASGATYKAGQTISYAGTATDKEDGTLGADKFTWTIRFQHDTHFHPFLGPITNTKSGSFTIPTNGEVSANVWYRIILDVVDSKGLTAEKIMDVHPVTSNVTLASNPTGLGLQLDGQPVTAPTTFTGVVGIQRTLGAPFQFKGGKYYQFTSWSDGGAASHVISTPSSTTTYTASFKQVGTIFEAESAKLSGAVVASSSAGYTGTGFVDYQNASADYVEWTVSESAAGSRSLDFRYANAGTASRPLEIKVNGTVVKASLAFPPTGAWTNWSIVTASGVTLNAGANKIRATAIGSSGPNVDHLSVR